MIQFDYCNIFEMGWHHQPENTIWGDEFQQQTIGKSLSDSWRLEANEVNFWQIWEDLKPQDYIQVYTNLCDTYYTCWK